MRIGVCLNPGHRPGNRIADNAEWDLRVIRWADELGYSEAWFGEHLTVPWEGVPAAELLIARAIGETSRIRLGPVALSVPFHHPAMLAHRLAYLDQIAAGRLNLGVGASGTRTDLELFGIDGAGGESRRMLWEGLDAVLRLWGDPGPYESKGEFWAVNKPESSFDGKAGFHLKPLQEPHPPISVRGLSPGSPSLGSAGERGYAPLSYALGTDYLKGHWAAVEAGAAAAGRTADRDSWRIVWDVFVAETDEEAIRLCLDGGPGEYLREFWLPLMSDLGQIDKFKGDPEMADDEVTPEYFLRTVAIVGSVDTVVEKIEAAVEATGGFGTLVQSGYDFAADPEPLRVSMELLADEVLPRVDRAPRSTAGA